MVKWKTFKTLEFSNRKKVQHCTKTRSNYIPSYNSNVDNLKWIYDFIGDTNFIDHLFAHERDSGVMCCMEESGKHGMVEIKWMSNVMIYDSAMV